MKNMMFFLLTTILLISTNSAWAQNLDYDYGFRQYQQLTYAAQTKGWDAQLYLNQQTIERLNTAYNTNYPEYQNLLLQLTEKVANDLNRGRVVPKQLTKRVRIADKTASLQNFARSYLNGQMSLEQLLETIEPKNISYRRHLHLYTYLTNLRDSQQANVPTGVSFTIIRPGSTNTFLVRYLRQRLSMLGYQNATDNPAYDLELESAVKQYQADHKLDRDGSVGPQTWSYLNRDIRQVVNTLRVNLDRARWLPDQLESERISVNLAEQSFSYIEAGIEVMNFKAINGRTDRQTPIMIDFIRNVVINPTWTVPFSIFVKDKLPLLKQDPSFVERGHYRLVDDLTGQDIDAYSVDWSLVDATNAHYTLIQKPGPHNALGFVKFPLQNPYAIYLHDTNDRHLFAKESRLLSSGCIRLEKPFEVAEKILGSPRWTVDTLKAATEFSPVPATDQTWLRTKKNIPVYLMYWTVFQHDDGRVVILPDSYAVDRQMLELAQAQSIL